jgi:hypothetical protein
MQPPQLISSDEPRGSADEGLIGEFWQFIVSHKKWWLIPVCLVLAVFGVLMLLGSTAAAPFIYTLF